MSYSTVIREEPDFAPSLEVAEKEEEEEEEERGSFFLDVSHLFSYPRIAQRLCLFILTRNLRDVHLDLNHTHLPAYVVQDVAAVRYQTT